MNQLNALMALSAVALFISFVVLVNLGFDMHLVQEWRMEGERTKANLFLLARGGIVGVLVLVSYLSMQLHDALKANESNTAEYKVFE